MFCTKLLAKARHTRKTHKDRTGYLQDLQRIEAKVFQVFQVAQYVAHSFQGLPILEDAFSSHR
ncbi:uncharacterized protein PHALS_09524 [Plasmopara halstedii]|uniref:Uncharacterized protein n=1 Tax=Plasmopara halstedii TaxID=4781 RepID=A0A0P1A665_PLAHL|nr:uncharacterized protein PHALS_09524 [Plasmopara halstedii]CEG35402.1 hypothetical protein PHALS_09524 [Plasmopara halstedii]|eukprot:XP_024571771.1 hypothetical protein PHALS_09524 [Plasmopara halstedii]